MLSQEMATPIKSISILKAYLIALLKIRSDCTYSNSYVYP
jgi:hypothetical protein